MVIQKIEKFGSVSDFMNHAILSAKKKISKITMSTLTLNKLPTYQVLTYVDIWLSTYLPLLVNVVFGRPLMGYPLPSFGKVSIQTKTNNKTKEKK